MTFTFDDARKSRAVRGCPKAARSWVEAANAYLAAGMTREQATESANALDVRGGARLVRRSSVEAASVADATFNDETRTISGVLVLGPESPAKRRRYAPRALESMARIISEWPVKSYLDHPDPKNTRADGARSVADRVGVLRNGRVVEGRVRADLQVGTRYAWVYEDAKLMPDGFALSINAVGLARKEKESGWEVFEDFVGADSVDVVPDGGTTKTIFEGDTPSSGKAITMEHDFDSSAAVIRELTESRAKEVARASSLDATVADLKKQIAELSEKNATATIEIERYRASEANRVRESELDTMLAQSGLKDVSASVREAFLMLPDAEKRKAAVEGLASAVKPTSRTASNGDAADYPPEMTAAALGIKAPVK